MDHFCQEAFRLNVKSSLSELRRVINGDGRNDPSPFYKIILNLDGSSLVFIPSVLQLTDVVISVGSLIIESFAKIPRLTEILTRNKRTNKQVSFLIVFFILYSEFSFIYLEKGYSIQQNILQQLFIL